MSMPSSTALDLEDIVIATYSALDDALTQAGIHCSDGKLVPRSGPKPEVDDREVLCLAVLQELLGFESDNEYHNWLHAHPTIRKLFPRLLNRQNFADRRAILTPLMARLCGAFCELAGEDDPPFSSLTPTRSMSAAQSGRERRSVSGDSLRQATAPR